MPSEPEPSLPEDSSTDTDAQELDSPRPADTAPAWPPERPKANIPPFVKRSGTWLRSHAKLWVSGVAVAAVVIAAILVWPMVDPREDEAEVRVREYLEAVRDKDLDKAEGMLRKLGSGAERLMTAEALDTNWTIESLQSEDFAHGSSVAYVNAVLRAKTGQEASFQFELTRPHGDVRFQIANGYVGLEIAGQRHEHLLINGQSVVSAEDGFLDRELRLYPGIYRFGHALEDFFDLDWQRRLLPGGSYSVEQTGQDVELSEERQEPWNLSAAGQERAQELLNARIDECVEKRVAIEAGCPFGVDQVSAGEDQEVSGDELEDIEWEVDEYPEANVRDQAGLFRYFDDSPGTVRLTATGHTAAGTLDIDVECQIDTTYLYLTTKDGREPAVNTITDHSSPDPYRWGTC